MNKKGFTLTEILVVLIVAGILMALILPNALQSVDKADDVAHEANMKNINAALMVCYAQNRDNVATPGWAMCDAQDGSELVTNGFLDTWPTHPVCTYTVAQDATTGGYVAAAAGNGC